MANADEKPWPANAIGFVVIRILRRMRAVRCDAASFNLQGSGGGEQEWVFLPACHHNSLAHLRHELEMIGSAVRFWEG